MGDIEEAPPPAALPPVNFCFLADSRPGRAGRVLMAIEGVASLFGTGLVARGEANARALSARLNRRLGISEAEALRMAARCLSGEEETWH